MTAPFSTASRTIVGILVLLTATAAVAQSDKGTPADERFAPVTAFMDTLVQEGKLAGLSTLVAKDGEIVYFESAGKRDMERGLAMTQDTLFRMHSMTKPIAAAALMILYDEGVVRLDDPVAKYIPEFADMKVYVSGDADTMVSEPAARPITILDLLTHQSGISYSFYGKHAVHDLYVAAGLGDYGEKKPDFTLGQMMTRLSKIPLKFQPGTQWQYGMSLDLIARVVEVASGESFADFLQKRIFTPLRMVDTGYYVPADKVERLSASYDKGPDGKLALYDDPQTSVYRDPPVFAGGSSGLVGSTMDYYVFGAMLLNRGEWQGVRILKPETVDLMLSNHLYDGVAFLPGQGFGLGGGLIVDDTAESQVPGSLGEYYWGGSDSTYFWVNPKKHLVMLVMAQYGNSREATFGDDIRKMIYDIYKTD